MSGRGRCGDSGRVPPWAVCEWLIVSAACMQALLGVQGYLNNDAMNSRLATVYSLTHYGTWRIDRPIESAPIPFEQGTIDKVQIDGRLLSSKPPMLTLLMTAEYAALQRWAGWSLDSEGDVEKFARFFNLTLVGFSYMAAVIFFALLMRLFIEDPLSRLVMLCALAFGTQLWGYATHLNNHVPAAGMLTAALYFSLGLAEGKLRPSPWRFAAFGLAGGLAPTFDVPSAIFVLPAGAWLFYRHPVKCLAFALPMGMIPLAVHAGALYASTGSILPVQTRKSVFLYEGSYWRNPLGIDALNEPKGVYLFHMLFGRVGLFSLYPILFAGVAAGLRALAGRPIRYRAHLLIGAAAFAILTAYYACKTNNYGGEAYGFRWYIIAMPVLLLMGAPLMSVLRRRWQWVFAGILLAVSIYSAYECARGPWGSNHEWTVRFFLGPSYGPP